MVAICAFDKGERAGDIEHGACQGHRQPPLGAVTNKQTIYLLLRRMYQNQLTHN